MANRNRPARTPAEKDSILMSLATDLAEKQLREGTASAQVICHYLKMASPREKLELEKTEKENRLLDAKANSIESGGRLEALYKNAVESMRKYSGDFSNETADEN